MRTVSAQIRPINDERTYVVRAGASAGRVCTSTGSGARDFAESVVRYRTVTDYCTPATLVKANIRQFFVGSGERTRSEGGGDTLRYYYCFFRSFARNGFAHGRRRFGPLPRRGLRLFVGQRKRT
jgi:hypothetical protein